MPGLLERLTLRLGALPARRVTWSLVAVFSVWVLLDVLVFQLTSGMARSSFDTMVRARVVAAAPDPRIVIIDIDEATLARMATEFGRWPRCLTILKSSNPQRSFGTSFFQMLTV